MRTAIATALTLGNAICGFAGIVVLTTQGTRGLSVAAALTFCAWLFDLCDGPVARRLGGATSFGAILDSMCDAVSFGVLPALIVVVTGREAIEPAAIVAAVAYLACAIMRLVRYTAAVLAASGATSRLWFAGLPSPVAGMSIAALTLWTTLPWLVVALAAATAALMISPIPYVHLVKAYVRRHVPVWTLIVPVAACVPFGWRVVLASAFLAYLVSGPAVVLVRGGGRATVQ